MFNKIRKPAVLLILVACVVALQPFLYAHVEDRHSAATSGTSTLAKSKSTDTSGKGGKRPASRKWKSPMMTAQTNNRVLEEIWNVWLEPPSIEPYNYSSKNNGRDYNMVRNLHTKVLDVLGRKKNGFFIECGAFDGVDLSNTLHLEREYNWTGLLIEADPKYYKELLNAHRKAWTINACLSPNPIPQKMNMTRIKHQNALSALSIIKPGMKKKANAEEFQVQCFPLASMLAALGKTGDVDYFSLDIEGAELAVLKTVPWDSVYIKVINIEVNPPGIKVVRAYMKKQNYVHAGYIKGSWIHDDLFIHRRWVDQMGFTDKFLSPH